jgi:CheY-like chemotaxis protein
MHADFRSSLTRLRACMERARLAHEGGDATSFRRRLEEFLFLGNARIQASLRPRHDAPPRLLVFHDRLSLVNLLREGLLEFGFVAHVEPVRSLEVLAMRLGALEPARRTLFVITAHLGGDSGLAALRRIRAHPRGNACPVLVLAQTERVHDVHLADAAGATAYRLYPNGIEDFRSLVEQLRGMLQTDCGNAAIERGA